MITPEEFPYIKSLHVNDCYAYQDFDIELFEYKPFSHLILTGKNGSGKSTILRALNTSFLMKYIHRYPNSDQNQVTLKDSQDVITFSPVIFQNSLFVFFQAKRQTQPNPVNTIVKETEFAGQMLLGGESFTRQFKQYLVNRKVEQAFHQIDSQYDKAKSVDIFFEELTSNFRDIFQDEKLELIFQRENFEFFIKLSDGRQLTFDVLSEGFSALLSILMDLLVRVDLIRKQVNDYSYNPCGIVLIDEPETHLHLQLQEQVLPLLTSLFPNIQFIAATHSPAVIASIKNATIFDLTTKESRNSEDTVGRSYSDLMMSHFELNNEYSSIADDIIAQVNQAVAEFGNDPARLREVLRPIYDANSAYLSPTLKVKFELLMADKEAKAVAHS